MRVIYISNTCSDKKYYEYIEKKGVRVSQQAQKYNLLLAEGISFNNVRVDMLSTQPINRQISKKFFFKREKEVSKGVNFEYIPFINYPLVRNMFLFLGVLNYILTCKVKKEKVIIICDTLNISAALGTMIIKEFTRWRYEVHYEEKSIN